MELKQLRNKKLVAGVAALTLAGTIAIGGSLAWFTAGGSADPYNFKAGNLEVQTTFDSNYKLLNGKMYVLGTNGEYHEFGGFEPGMTYDISATVKNTGSLELYAKYDMRAATTIYYDSNREETANPTKLTGDDNPVLFSVSGIDNVWDWISPLEDAEAIPFVDTDGNLYLYLTPGAYAIPNFTIDMETNAGEIDNRFQDCAVEVTGGVEATQALGGATMAQWDVDMSDLLPYMDLSDNVRSRASAQPRYTVAEVVEYIQNRG